MEKTKDISGGAGKVAEYLKAAGIWGANKVLNTTMNNTIIDILNDNDCKGLAAAYQSYLNAAAVAGVAVTGYKATQFIKEYIAHPEKYNGAEELADGEYGYGDNYLSY